MTIERYSLEGKKNGHPFYLVFENNPKTIEEAREIAKKLVDNNSYSEIKIFEHVVNTVETVTR